MGSSSAVSILELNSILCKELMLIQLLGKSNTQLWKELSKISLHYHMQPATPITGYSTGNCKPATQPQLRRTLRRHSFHFELCSLLPFLKLFKAIKCVLAIWRFLHEICNVYSGFACFSVHHRSFLFTKLAIYETQYLIFC